MWRCDEGLPCSDQIRVTIKGMFSYNGDTIKLKEHLRDFLVQLKEHAGEDTADLYLEETERQMSEAQTLKASIPGMAVEYPKQHLCAATNME